MDWDNYFSPYDNNINNWIADLSTIGFAIGFVLMMVLDVVMG